MKTIAATILTAIAWLCVLHAAHALDVGVTIAEAEALLAKGDSDAALRAADQAVAAAGTDPETFHCRFRVHMARAQDEDALADVDKAIALAPGNAKYLAARAELRLARKEYDKALSDLDAAIAADELEAEFGLVEIEQQCERSFADRVKVGKAIRAKAGKDLR